MSKATASTHEDFAACWNKLLKSTVQVNTELSMGMPTKENGWDVISGGANYTDGANTGMATLYSPQQVTDKQ
ncbi:hypothetical protein G7074_00710 [Pedobacter sp. HDW13]|uniref:hypothetical protein n=1 Tax=unclassified Pedobacter TaxID=2628915 RepID=UPI000F598406|nr:MULTISPECIES: hypothetical protein [unclassified Pedobacter]QIL37933.1 hypothetical protein G7074_00710 [Pedobacter sp. HDW13]RQO68934.1 hypothetical protein DBR40_18280 [Pedobacter sp. KBW01]